jgi:pimeloyl-ACP methyl ester carboxylesterase
VRLPGQGDGNSSATLADQVTAVASAVDAAGGLPMVVGHSAASTLAWLAADRRPDKMGGVVLIGGFPSSDGTAYADFFPIEDGAMPFPGWKAFEGPDSADLDEGQKQALADAAIPVPERVARGIVHLTNERRFEIPVTVICPEFSPADAKGWIESGQIPELAQARHVSLIDIDSGHWPMITAPRTLADLLSGIAT